MVVQKDLTDDEIDRVFHALAAATRRDILRRTIESEHSVSALAQDYDMSFAAVQKHVAVLEEAGLIIKRAEGRERLVRADPIMIARAKALNSYQPSPRQSHSENPLQMEAQLAHLNPTRF